MSPNNAPILKECKTLKNIVCSATEAECGGLFNNTKSAIVIKNILEGIRHHQQPIGIKTDNNTANSFAHENIRSKRSKAWDMRYHWLKQEDVRKIIKIYWDRGVNNNAEYLTKHNSLAHHKSERPKYILKGFSMTKVCSCIISKFLARVC